MPSAYREVIILLPLKWLMMVFNFGSCYGLLASGNGRGHPGEGSIRTSGFYEWNVMPFGFATHPEHLRD